MGKRDGDIRILIVDDHPIFRDALRKLLETEPGFHIIGESRNGAAAVKLAFRLKPDVLLLDVAIPRHPVLEPLRELEHAPIPIRVILLAGAIEKAEVVEALHLGVRGVVLRDSTTQLLCKSIRRVVAGEYWLGHECVSDIVEALGDFISSPIREHGKKLFGLTRRELEIIALVVGGYANKFIAEQFSISEHTVKHHLTNIFDKVGVSNRLELALFAIHHCLVNTSTPPYLQTTPKPRSEIGGLDGVRTPRVIPQALHPPSR